MALIKGITVTLYDKVEAGVDSFNKTIWTETPVEVENVLVTPTSATDITTETSLYGKASVYQLCIPKGDSHTWEDRVVEFFGAKWHTFGYSQYWIEENVPLEWNRKISVEKYG